MKIRGAAEPVRLTGVTSAGPFPGLPPARTRFRHRWPSQAPYAANPLRSRTPRPTGTRPLGLIRHRAAAALAGLRSLCRNQTG
jgi:hypothetical protein